MPILGPRETPEQRAERRGFEQWAKDAARRAHERYRTTAGSGIAEVFLQVLLEKREHLEPPALVRIYSHSDAGTAAELFAIEAEILAERGYVPVSQASGVEHAELGGLTLPSAYEQHTLTVTYGKRPAGEA